MRLREWLEESRERYMERAHRLDRLALTHLERVAFALMTPRTPYERSVEQWREWRRTGKVSGPFAATRAKHIGEMRAYDRAYGLGKKSHETGRTWALRLGGSIKGLGPVKAPFACCLMQPLARDVPVCMDLHMARLLGFPSDASSEWSASRFEGAQRQLRVLADMVRVPPFVAQWACWDWKRSAGMDAQPMWVVETDIAKDLSA